MSNAIKSDLTKRASRRVYRAMGINRPELDMLISVATYLMLHGKDSAARKSLLDFSYININHMEKANAVFESLRSKSFIDHEYRGRGLGFFLTNKGFEAINMYEREMDVVERWFQSKTDVKLSEVGTLTEHIKRREGKTF